MAASKPSAEQLITENIDVWTSAIKKRGSQGRGSNKKITLYGINKLRELILELAVRGLLVPQDTSDEPATVLLEKIAAEKKQLIKDGKLKKPKILVPVSDGEGLFELPVGWSWSRIGEFSAIGPRNSLEDNLEVSFVPMPLVSTSYKGDHGQEIRLWSELKKGYTHFSDGDIGLAKITPCFENSKASIFSNLKNGFGAGTTELHIARPLLKEINPLFVLLYLKAPMFLEVGKTKMTGSAGQKRIPKSFFEGNPFPLPPEAEQPRIVAKVDELMALCDQLEQQTESSLTAHQTLVETLLNTLLTAAQITGTKESNSQSNSNQESSFDQAWNRIAQHFDVLFTTEHSIDQLKQTILQLAVMGKLVPQDPNDEPASVLLEKIAAEKEQLIKDKKIKKQKVLPPISDDEKPFKLPAGWEWCRLGQLGFDMGGGTPSKGRSDYWNGQIPWVSPKDMKVDYIDSSIDGITELAIQETVVNMVPESSLLVVVRGMILDHSFPVAINRLPVAINQDMKALVFSDTDKDFLLVLMKGFKTDFLDLVERSSHGTCKLISEKLWTKVIAMPPQAEQPYIAARVNELMTLCDTLKSCIIKSQTTQLDLADAMAEQALN